MNKTIIIAIIAVIIVGGVSFYAGMHYGRGKLATGRGSGNLSPAERQARFQQMGANGSNGQRGARSGGELATGEIISKDDQSLTVKLRDDRLPASPELQRGEPDGQGGSKIVLFSTSTQIMKATAGSADDLAVGTSVTVNGSANSDGSVTADSIQIRPMPAPAQ